MTVPAAPVMGKDASCLPLPGKAKKNKKHIYTSPLLCQEDSLTCVCLLLCSAATTFSQCSAEDFEMLILRGGGVCLKNQPSLSDVVGTAQCGNGMLEAGEQCDCGTPEVDETIEHLVIRLDV